MTKELKVLNKNLASKPPFLPIIDNFGVINKTYVDDNKKRERKIDTFDCLNIGVPIIKPVKYWIYLNELINLSDNKETFKTILLENIKSISASIAKELGLKYSFLIPCPGGAFSFSTDDDLKTRLTNSSRYALYTLYRILLGRDFKALCDEINYEKIKQGLYFAIDELKKVKTPKELKRKFPSIYDDYIGWKDKYQEVLAIKACDIQSMKLSAIQNLGKGFGSYGEWSEYFEDGFSLEKFIDTISSMYTIYVDNLESYLKFLSKIPVYFTPSCKIDEDKMALFTAYHYLINGLLNVEDKQKYLYYVASYLKEYEGNNTTLEVIDYLSEKANQQRIINYEYIEEQFRDMLIDSPELNFIDFSREYFVGMTPDEINEYMDDYLNDIRLNWDFLLPNDQTISRETTDLINKASKTTKVRDEEEFKEYLMKLYMDKKSFFDSSNPFCMLKGKSTFSGYVGYCYSNGKVILDKYFENEKTKKLAFGEAIYIMDLPNFYLLSKMSKAEIINERLCKRIYHRGEWKDRAQEEIESGNPIAKSELVFLLKKMNSKKDMK